MMHGMLLEGKDALTPIAIPRGRARSLILLCDSTRQNLDPAELRLAIYHFEFGWQVQRVLLDGAKGPEEIVFDEPEHIGGLSIQREDDGDVAIAWMVM